MLQSRTILAGRTILLIDALPSSRQMITAILRDHGCRNLHHAKHAREALDLLDVTAGRLDLILSAVELPRIGGLEVIKAVRLGRTRGLASTPAVLFHPWPDHALRQQAEALDVAYVFGLPIAAAALCDRLAEIMAGPQLLVRSADDYAAAATDWAAAAPAEPTERYGPSAREAALRDARLLAGELREGPAAGRADTPPSSAA